MNKKFASLGFVIVCIVLAVLLLSDAISPLTSGIIFAAALVLLGVVSRGFTGTDRKHQVK